MTTVTAVFTVQSLILVFCCLFGGCLGGPVKHSLSLKQEWWANAFELYPWAKGCADRDDYLFVMVDVISCRYRKEGRWFIALSTATSRTSAVACRMNTALSVLSIRHHPLGPRPSPRRFTDTHSHFSPQDINYHSLFWYTHVCIQQNVQEEEVLGSGRLFITQLVSPK